MGIISIPDRSSEVLEILAANKEFYVATSHLCNSLMIGRRVVYSSISQLRSIGYIIESDSRRGYKFLSAPDLMLSEEIRRDLNAGRFGNAIHSYLSLVSTNQTAFKLAENDACEGTVVIAERQTGGRGRLGRSWHSPANKGLYFSIILKPGIPPASAPGLNLVASLAVLDALKEITGITAEVKWPNDCLYEGKKFCGILTELSAEMDAVKFIILGIGININQKQGSFPAGIGQQATSIREFTGGKLNRIKYLQEILRSLNGYYADFKKKGLEPLLGGYFKYASFIGKEIRLRHGRIGIRGKAVGIDRTGALIVKTPAGEKKYCAGEVTVAK
ncbi:MAG: biotin--[acetyl-CoA-carboxylase] ligase [candidate division Zixibacteria bacterium]|nr:biotin--[acetyl-CoA-carboxylase] ligase [candidate division Zixibacteria bacterium]